MRLRYLHLPRCGPLVNIEIVFGQEEMLYGPGEPGKRRGAINFIVGVNGTGKSSLLRAIYQTFRALRAQELPPFPVTLAWDWEESRGTETVIFHYPAATAAETFVVRLTECVESGADTAAWSERVREIAEAGSIAAARGADAIRGSFLQAVLPKKVVAYTSGAETLWDSLEHRDYRPDPDQDVGISQDGERPPGWTIEREREEVQPMHMENALVSLATKTSGDSMAGADSLYSFDPETGKKLIAELEPFSEISKKAFANQVLRSRQTPDPCFRVRTDGLRLAAVALALWQTAQEICGKIAEDDRAALRQRFLDLKSKGAPGEDACRVFNALDWFWPTHPEFLLPRRRGAGFQAATRTTVPPGPGR